MASSNLNLKIYIYIRLQINVYFALNISEFFDFYKINTENICEFNANI